MSNWDLNQFYPFNQADKTALPIVTTLLKAYTVTAGCLETLGKRLEQKLEFGFFTSGTEIIKEGESGRDIFLLCSGSMDVLVNNQVVVQMEAPKLVGKKQLFLRTPNGQQQLELQLKHKHWLLKFQWTLLFAILTTGTSLISSSLRKEVFFRIFFKVFRNAYLNMFFYRKFFGKKPVQL